MRTLLALLLTVFMVSSFVRGQYNYTEALHKSLLFYEAQRSGIQADNYRIPWRWDSHMDDVVPGGYYEAASPMKFNFPTAFTNTMLAWGAITFQAGYDAAGETANLKSCLKQFTDYFIASHTSPLELYAQIGYAQIEFSYWSRPEDMPASLPRPAYKITATEPGSDLAGETAAALAASSIVYRNLGDAPMADLVLSHARDLFDFADQYRGFYSRLIPVQEYYNSSAYTDELAWAAIWLYKATNEDAYVIKAESFFEEFGLNQAAGPFDWDSKLLGVHILLFKATGKAVYRTLVANAANTVLNAGTYTPKGLLFLSNWGSLCSAANTVLGLLHVAEAGIETAAIHTLARNQIGYMLGDTGRSFMVGFGENPPLRVHHAAASCQDRPAPCNWLDYQSPGPNPQVIVGALVGGPDIDDVYEDIRSNYIQNEVTLDYNAGFQGVLAALVALDNAKN